LAVGFVRRFTATLRFAFPLRFTVLFLLPFFFAFVFALRFTWSGSFALPVSRFHSSNVSLEIFPSTNSCANFLRCAWLLNGISPPCYLESFLKRNDRGRDPPLRKIEVDPRWMVAGASGTVHSTAFSPDLIVQP
ncbi:MAG: hypothetical protein ACXWM0_19100, partial [Vulcanimicrobiaceae bacterium]